MGRGVSAPRSAIFNIPRKKGRRVTKTDLKEKPVDELREIMAQHFEGITEDTTKREMIEIIDEEWEGFLEERLNPSEEETDETPDEELSDRQAFLSKDLYTGHPPA